MFQRKHAKMAHVQWLVHSSKTILLEAHHPRELHITNGCNSITADLIEDLVHVQMLRVNERVPRYSKEDPGNLYFVRRSWASLDMSFHSSPRKWIHISLYGILLARHVLNTEPWICSTLHRSVVKKSLKSTVKYITSLTMRS
ncbi:uncharacterized protein EI90DRAFT_139867 [Cantharellus anzutake]|uniref:uncharacterized protein n=1 Tax=Cantharellus anzutake TaxID=1750568 RepID=UPI001905210D|nr:uncharacterized protein EI90DRAFT_139867 [Cantharellus anzutake]KAF8317752.1 hypothetical protein EI90DRAFT_139867 [Cantharellus anzutake]